MGETDQPRGAKMTIVAGTELARGVKVPEEFEMDLELSEGPDGQIIINALTIRREGGITASMFRRIPFGPLEAMLNRARFESLLREVPAGPGHLRATAQIYRERVARGLPPAPAIAALMGVKIRTAHGYISQARKAGLLPPARKGRAG